MPFPMSIDARLDGDALLRILRLVERFEDGWKRGKPTPLEELMREAPGTERAELLRQALGVELDYRRGRGERPAVEDYMRRFPDNARVIRSAFNDPTVSLANGSTWDRPVVQHSEPVPTTIGKFAVIGRLGSGAQGSALLARDPDLGHLVVVKRYHTAADLARAEGAIQDGHALVRLRSRYTPQCYGIERAGDELVLVMEYIPGRNLSEVVASGPPGLVTAARWVERVARGLEAVHACGLVHRDIKPSNIVIADDGLPRLVDFGLAAHLGSLELRGISGTPAYMAPEQARDQWERIDARTDVYGLGAVLYTLLTGQPPHPGQTVDESLEHARQGVVTPARELNRSIPRDLDRVVMKALQSDPAQRFATASQMRQALRRCRSPLRRSAAVRAGLFLLIAAAAYPAAGWLATRDGDGQKSLTVPTQQLIRVDRGGRAVALQEAVPLVSGDKLWIECDLPAGWQASAFWLDSEGKVTELSPLGIERRGSVDRLSYPPPHVADNSVTLEGPPGTELVLVCARPGPRVSLHEVDPKLLAVASRTVLQRRATILLGHGRVVMLNHPGRADPDGVFSPAATRGIVRRQPSEARDAIERFQQIAAMLGQRIAFTAGAAFSHEQPRQP
jgi:hypothetical protein